HGSVAGSWVGDGEEPTHSRLAFRLPCPPVTSIFRTETMPSLDTLARRETPTSNSISRAVGSMNGTVKIVYESILTFCGADAHGRGLSPGSGTTHEKLQVKSFEKSFVRVVGTNAVPPAGSANRP